MTHKLIIKTLGSQVAREWVRLSDGLVETNTATIAALEAELTKCAGIHTADGDEYTGATPVTPPVNPVESLTIRVRTGQVVVTTPTGAFTIYPRETFSWGGGDTNLVDVSGLTFTGNANALYSLHWETP